MFRKVVSLLACMTMASTAFAIDNGRYNIVSSLSGLSLDVYGESRDDGADLIQWSSTGGPNQQFDVEALGDGTYSIRAAHSGKALDVFQFNANDGADLKQWSFTGGQNQRWRINDTGGGLYSITSAFSNKALDVWEMSRDRGAEVKLFHWWGGPNQRWQFVRVGSSPNPNPNPNPNPGPNPSATGGCGNNPTLASGRHSMNVNGDHREYILDVPGNYDKNKPYRLIFAFHWLGGSAGAVAPGYYGIKDQAQGQAIFVAPDRYNTNGHDDSGWPNTTGRDMAFVRAMINELKGGLCIDSNRIFSTGWSYGGMMSLAVGREFGGVIRAVAPMSGALFTPFNDSGKPMAAWIAHGYYDNFVDFNTVGKAARDYYVQHNHCSAQTRPVPPDECVEYQGCDAGAPVVWCQFAGPHGTPGFAGSAIWSFFNRF